jgi:hypothetical protein
MNQIINLGMYSNNITFIYVVAGDNSHYSNLQTSINSARKIYPEAKILIGDFDAKFISDDKNTEIINLQHVKFDRAKTFKHIIWQYKYYVAQLSTTKYNLYLDTDTALVNNLDNLIAESDGKFLIAKHFWVENVAKFKVVSETQTETNSWIDYLKLTDDMNFCAAGVFFFEKNEKNLKILKDTFDLHNEIYENRDYVLGIYDETLLNSILQRNLDDVIYYNGSINHCSMPNMPMIMQNGTLYGKNSFDAEFKQITCLHCDVYRRDPSAGYPLEISNLIKTLFNL